MQQHQTRTAASGYSDAFTYSSSLCVPLALDRYIYNARHKPESRDQVQQRPTPDNNHEQTSQAFSRQSIIRRPRSRSSSSALTGHSRPSLAPATIPPVPGPLPGLVAAGPPSSPSTVSSAGQGMLLLQHIGPAAATLRSIAVDAAVGNDNLSRPKASSFFSLSPIPSSSSSSPSSFSTSSTSSSSSPSSSSSSSCSSPSSPSSSSPSSSLSCSSSSSPSSSAATALASTTKPALATAPAKASSSSLRLPHRVQLVRPGDALFAFDLGNASMPLDQDASRSSTVGQMNGHIHRPESVSSARTMTSADSATTADSGSSRLFVQRNGRTYLSDPNNPYPLPTDLTELHRQTLRTLLLIQVFGAPVTCPSIIQKPPSRVLEIGCGSGFWSMMCHQFFKARGHSGISFTGVDIAPLAPDGSSATGTTPMKPDSDMTWTFVQHDLLQAPWPLPSEEYDLIMCKDMSMVINNNNHQLFLDEYIRLLRPGGVLEVWDSDHVIRMLRPHIPAAVSGEDTDDQLVASSLGAYLITANTPLSAPLNPFLIEYNQWLTRAFENRSLNPFPCALVGPSLLQESEALTDVRSHRMAIPLSDVRWEREGVGGIITTDGKATFETKEREPGPKMEKKTLSAGQTALRQTAMLTVVQQVQAMEHILREVSGKSQDEWDVWLGKMMGDLMSEGGTNLGECLEFGAWSAKKKTKKT